MAGAAAPSCPRSASPFQRSAIAPLRAPDLAVDHGRRRSRPALRGALTTTAARAQSSAKASAVSAIDDQPAVGELADAAGGVAAERRHRRRLVRRRARVGVGGEPFLDREGVAAAATARRAARRRRASPAPAPSAETSTSGCGVGTAHRRRDRRPAPRRSSAAACAAGTAAAARRCASSSGPVPKAAHLADRARQAARPTARPRSSSRCRRPSAARTAPSKPNGMRQHAEDARRHHPDRDDRHGEQIGDHAIGRERGGNERRRKAWWQARRPARRG